MGESWRVVNFSSEREEGSFLVHYHDQVFPVSPRSLNDLLSVAADRCQSDELFCIADSLGQLPLSTATDWIAVRRRHRNKQVLRGQLAQLFREQPKIAAAVDHVVAEANSDPDQLDALLERQNYRLAFWRTAARDLGYRRFFDINTLVGLRAEDETVFSETHALILAWLADAVLDGVRVDHPDGLRDPQEYFQRLYDACPQAWIVAEKILRAGERLPKSWPIAGTTGYDFIYRLTNLFVDPAGRSSIDEALCRFHRRADGFRRRGKGDKSSSTARFAGQRCQSADRAARADMRAAPSPTRLHPTRTPRSLATGRCRASGVPHLCAGSIRTAERRRIFLRSRKL